MRFAAGRESLETTDIDGINGDVGLDSGGSGGAQRGLIVHAGLADTVAEIDDGFFLGDFSERLHDGLQGEEFAVGVEGVVVGVIGGECAGGFGGSFGAAGGAVVEALACAGCVCGEHAEDFGLVVGEIEIDAHVGGQGDEGDQVGGLHAGLHEFFGGVDAAIDLLGVHAGEVEK